MSANSSTDTQASSFAIATHALSKTYGAFQALQNVDLRVPAGALFGFLGPNGAGKSTTIRILLGLLKASHGRAEILGGEAWRDGARLRREVGYLPGDVRFYDHLRGRSVLAIFDRARGGNCGQEIARLAGRFALPLNKRVRDYSRGMKQKLGIIQALMHRPRVLILDEPTTALDPLMREILYSELRQVAAEGRTVLFSSHTLREVEELCDEVAILRKGRLVEQQRIEVLQKRAVRHVHLKFDPARSLPANLPAGLRIAERVGPQWHGTWSGPIEQLLDWLRTCAVLDLTIAPPDLEELFLAYYGDDAPAAGAA